jgi:GAF domain-containing protein
MSKDPSGGSGSAPGPLLLGGGDVVEQLRTTLERVGELARVLEASLHTLVEGQAKATAPDRSADLEQRLQRAEAEMQELATQLVDSEHKAGRLMNLYVATYQLHSSLSPADVQTTIAEIAIDLLGARKFVLLLRPEEGGDCEITLRHGMGEDELPPYSGDSYRGGDPMVDATLIDGVLRTGPAPDSPAQAVVPLRISGEVVGAVVLLQFFEHKSVLRSEDRDLLDLLSAHAASALYAARLFATKDRKLRTLQSLVNLARGE